MFCLICRSFVGQSWQNTGIRSLTRIAPTCLAVSKEAAVVAIPSIVQHSLAKSIEDILLILSVLFVLFGSHVNMRSVEIGKVHPTSAHLECANGVT